MRPQVQGTTSLSLRNDLAELDTLAEALREFGHRHGLSSRVVFDLNLALEEVITNAISYGFNDTDSHTLRVELSLEDGQVTAVVEDDGLPFNPLSVPEPDTGTPLEERVVGGLGVHLARQVMDSLEYLRVGEINRLVMEKKVG
ncbi:MAG: ATP-binding protein [Armatimonadetes bacterium]|nr:ATP-binding protein [Armatimonadota bacterium]